MEWKFESGLPIYSQIIDQMSMSIAAGIYGPGDKLPSVRELATDAGVNPNTMQRALGELERRGLVHSERTSGRFVTMETGVLQELRETMIGEYIEEFFGKLRKMGMTDQEIAEAVERWKDSSGNLDSRGR